MPCENKSSLFMTRMADRRVADLSGPSDIREMPTSVFMDSTLTVSSFAASLMKGKCYFSREQQPLFSRNPQARRTLTGWKGSLEGGYYDWTCRAHGACASFARLEAAYQIFSLLGSPANHVGMVANNQEFDIGRNTLWQRNDIRKTTPTTVEVPPLSISSRG